MSLRVVLVLALSALLVVTAVACDRTLGTTNFTNVTASGDLTSGDDVIVGDDLTVTDALTTADLTVSDDATVTDQLTVSGRMKMDTAGITQTVASGENIGMLPNIDSATVITTTDGALWTVGASEVWYIDRVFCHVTTNFDCTGDDCTIEIGDGTDIDGYLDLDDGELQTTDTEIAGLPTGWQGFGSTDTRGAYLAAGGGVVEANDTIDIKIEDNSDNSNPTAGAATCYIVYWRLQ